MNRPNDESSKQTKPSRRLHFTLAALFLILISILAGTGLARLARWFQAPPAESTAPKPESTLSPIPARLFRDWGKPDFVVVLSAQQHGYVLPCGCSFPQVGGLERRYNFLQFLAKERGWPIVAVDLGDVPQKNGPAYHLPNVQGLIKYRYSMRALKKMDYLAVGVGEYEAALGLEQIEGEWALNEPKPAVLLANLENLGDYPGFKTLATGTVSGPNLKVGVTSVIGPTVKENIRDPKLKLLVGVPQGTPGMAQVLSEQWKVMQAEKVDLPILLYHGTATPRKGDGQKEALLCAETFPQFPVIVCLSEDDLAPESPDEVTTKAGTTSYVVGLGHKGKHIGVLGVYRKAAPNGAFSFQFKYQRVEMGIEYVTPKEQEANHPIIKMMEDYTQELKRDNYLGKYVPSKHPLQAMDAVKGLKNPGNGVPTYVGSERCMKCHDPAYEVWKTSDHSHAYQTLVDAKRPSLRQFDGECIVCHTVGFTYNSGFQDAVQTPKLKNVGCESCHGPGSLHAANPLNQEWRERMNESWRHAKNKNLAIERMCKNCHDEDNDVTWVHTPERNPFNEKWSKIIHTAPQGEE
ncbi:MAG TPA: multiheme c-type cytochrome [Gemmataceae bacterium]|jgi:hypothetical protein